MEFLLVPVVLVVVVAVLAGVAYHRKKDQPLGDERVDDRGNQVTDGSQRQMRRRQTPPGPGGMGEF